MNIEPLLTLYLDAKEAVMADPKWAAEVDYFESLRVADLTEQRFLREHAFVVLNSGMRATVVAQRWPAFVAAFDAWAGGAARVHAERARIRPLAMAAFGHKRKVDGILQAAWMLTMYAGGIESLQTHLLSDQTSVDWLEMWPFIGPITKYHLAKNLGIDCVKPDRHLVRIAEAAGFEGAEGPLALCRQVQEDTGERLSVIDLVLWRWAATTPGYVDIVARGTHA